MYVKNICLEGKEEELLYKSITYLILKGTSVSEKDYFLIILLERQIYYCGTREKALTNIILNKHHDYKLKTAWVDFKKTYDSVTHT
ncbi:hypothetical protein G9O61_00g022190, partial [Vairimorpha ceranae]